MAQQWNPMPEAVVVWPLQNGATMKVAGILIASMAACLLLGAAGCGLGSLQCNEMGCSDGLTLDFEDSDGNRLNGVSGDVTADGEVITIACDEDGRGSGDGYRCVGSGSVFVEVTGVSEISLNVRDTDPSSSLAYIGGVDVSFRAYRPNGPDCPPECQQAERTVTMVPTQASGD